MEKEFEQFVIAKKDFELQFESRHQVTEEELNNYYLEKAVAEMQEGLVWILVLFVAKKIKCGIIGRRRK